MGKVGCSCFSLAMEMNIDYTTIRYESHCHSTRMTTRTDTNNGENDDELQWETSQMARKTHRITRLYGKKQTDMSQRAAKLDH